METDEQRTRKIEKKILMISFAGTFIFLAVEAVMAVVTHSKALFMDCIWDGSDLLMLIPMMYVVTLLKLPESEKRPYGYSQLESVMVVIKCTMLTVLTVSLIIDGINSIIHGGNMVNGMVIAIYQMALSLACWLNYCYLSRQAGKITSPTAKAEIFIWKLDGCSTLGVGLGFIVQVIFLKTSFAWAAPYVDPLIAIIMALVVIREPVKLAFKNIRNLLLFAPDKDIRDRLKEIVDSVFDDTELECTFIDVIQTGRKMWIEVYFTKNSRMVDLYKLEEIRDDIAESLKREYRDTYIALVPDLED